MTAPLSSRTAGPAGGPSTRPWSMFISGEPMKPATKTLAGHRRGPAGGHLLDAPVHHHDPVGHGHRLDLVVGDVDHRRAQPAMQVDRSPTASARAAWRRGSTAARRTGRPSACARWRGRSRRAVSGRPKAGPAGGPATASSRRIAGRLRDPLVDLGLGLAGQLQREAPCSRRPSCAGRAHRTGTPLRCRGPWAATSLTRAVDGDVARGDRLEPGYHPQQRGLAAARRPDEHHEFAVLDGERYVLHGLDAAVLLADTSSPTVAIPPSLSRPASAPMRSSPCM